MRFYIIKIAIGENMKILEIIPQLSSGGGERFTVDLCNELSKKHEVILCVLHSLEKTGFYLHEVSSQIKIISLNKRAGIDLKLPFKIFRLVQKVKPDVIHTHLRGIVYSGLAILWYRDTACFHTVHNSAKQEAGGFISCGVRKYFFLTGLVHAITISEESNNSFVDFYHRRAVMIPNGRNIPKNIIVSEKVKSEFAKYRAIPETCVLVNLARIDEVKRQTMLTRIVKRLNEEGYKLSMLMIGNNKNSKLVAEIDSYHCEYVFVLGEKSNPLEYLKMADGYCLMSSYEGMPISLIEALGTGNIPICTPVGGIVNVIKDGVNGILAKDISENECYSAIKRFLGLKEYEIRKMKENALLSYTSYSMTECAKKYECLFYSYVKSH